MIKNILEYLEESAGKFPDKIAFADAGEAVTYAALMERAKRIGTKLAGLGTKGRPVAIVIEKSAAAMAAFMGSIYSGNFYVPIDVEMPKHRIDTILMTLSPIAIVYQERNAKLVESLSFNGIGIAYEEGVKEPVDEIRLQAIRRESIDTDPIYALFTSGSTGIPKGVVVCHRSVIDYADWVVDTFALDEHTVFGNQTPFYFSMSVLDIYSTLRSAATIYLIPKNLFMFPIKLLEFIEEKKINTIYWVPSALCMVANLRALEKITPECLQNILFAGEVMPTRQLNLWRHHLPQARYSNLFGPTEITDIGIYYTLDREFEDDEPIPIGKACDNVDVFVLNEQNQVVGSDSDEIGELYVRGSFLAHGYYNNPAKTQEAFVQNPLNTSYPEVVYKTGDLVRWNTRGELVYVSRKDFQIKHMGYRIELGEIEAAISAMPGMELCVCIYDEKKDKIVLLYQGDTITKKEILAAARERLPHYMIPNAIRQYEEMPLNENGKINRKFLKENYDKSCNGE